VIARAALAVYILVSFALSQSLPTPEKPAAGADSKRTELIMHSLERVNSEVQALRLAENRAIGYAVTGALYWSFDPKRSRQLFRSVGAELITCDLEAESDVRENPVTRGIEAIEYNPLRAQLLALVAQHDAELSLELLVQTRPGRLAEAMLKSPRQVPDPSAKLTGYDAMSQQISREVALEQSLALIAADQDPDMAILMVRDSIVKGVSYNIMPLLKKIAAKDEKKARDLATEVVKSMLQIDMVKNRQYVQIVESFLKTDIRESTAENKFIAFSEAELKALAGKLFETLMQLPTSTTLIMLTNQALPSLRRFLPEKIGELEQRTLYNQKTLSSQIPASQQRKIWDPAASPEELIREIGRTQDDAEKAAGNRMLLSMLAQITDHSTAKRLVDQIQDGKVRASALQQLERIRTGEIIAAGKLDDARLAVKALTDKKAKIRGLVRLALRYQKAGSEKDLQNAKEAMKEARALTVDLPDSGEEIDELVELVKGYIVVDPNIAFQLLEGLVAPIDEYVQAAAIVSKYEKRKTEFKKGELIMKMSGLQGSTQPLFRYMPQLQALGCLDLARMNLLIDRFSRADERTFIRLFVLQAYTTDLSLAK
jgi:hypothetical protein